MEIPEMRTVMERIHPFDEVTWAAFAACWKPVSYARNEPITREGETERYFYFVLDGVQRLYHLGDGQEHILGFSFDNSFSGVFDSFIKQRPATLFLDAVTDSRLLAITYSDFIRLMEGYPAVERWFRKFMTEILIGRLEREVELLSCTAEERFERLVQRSPRPVQLIPNKHLASYLGMAPETLSRVKQKVLNRIS